MSSIPFGAWFGIAIFLLGAWGKDIRGVVVGLVLIAITVLAMTRREPPTDSDAGTSEPAA